MTESPGRASWPAWSRSSAGRAPDVGTGEGPLAIELARRGMTVVSVHADDEERRKEGLLADEARVTTKITFVHGNAANVLGGQVSAVHTDDVMAEVIATLPEQVEVCALITAQSAGGLALAGGDAVWVACDTSAVIVSVAHDAAIGG